MTPAAGVIRLDISRLLSRAGLGAPTGVDRVELAWIEWALSPRWRDAQFVARVASGTYAIDRVDMPEVLAAVRGDAVPTLDARGAISLKKRMAVRRIESLLRRRAVPMRPAEVYANVGHSNLSPRFIAEMRAKGAERVIVKIHDVIPLEYPEFARNDGPQKMRARLQAARMADGLVFNSGDTARRALPRINPETQYAVAPLGIDIRAVDAPEHGGFVCLGTIEPRKNHALLLDVWAMLAAPSVLHIIGRRGWLNEAVFARLDANPPHVREHGDLDDDAMRLMLAGARALLFPSFAEGYGLPMAEALALGVPVIASDLPALREVGGNAATFLPTNDVSAWAAAIAAPPLRTDAALQRWAVPRWRDHFARVDDLLHRL